MTQGITHRVLGLGSQTDPMRYQKEVSLVRTQAAFTQERAKSMFLDGCERGHLPVVQWIYAQGIGDSLLDRGFLRACAKDRLAVAQWLYPLCLDRRRGCGNLTRPEKEKEHDLDEMWSWLHSGPLNNLTTGWWTISQWFYIIGLDLHVRCNQALTVACERNYLEMAQWLWSLGAKPKLDSYLARRMSWNGYLQMLQWLHEQGIDLAVHYRSMASEACKNNHLTMAQWLQTLGVSFGDPSIITSVCGRGHLKMAQWLHSQGVSPHVWESATLRRACEGDHFEMVAWLMEQGMDPNTCSRQIMDRACRNNDLLKLKWMHSLGVDLFPENDCYLWTACDHNSLKTAQWLHEQGAELSERHLKRACIDSNLQMLEWMLTLDVPNELVQELADRYHRGEVGDLLRYHIRCKRTKRAGS